MDLCVCLWVGGQGEDLISGIFEVASELFRKPFFVYFGAKTSQRTMPMKTCETGREAVGAK